ncbi:oxygenase MpaB family protein [Williamsia sp. D3]|uniref:oxygenase MpaB family protein n=1 Tax=Williamsia sp. D3 TaxID=1313067 RepID=UPI0003D2B2C3|nr:oxygenase MpaB family protein [Williamsia sp. D3]ETD30080.1 hypothetical protein W823_26150 [Williamsia sp. D3]
MRTPTKTADLLTLMGSANNTANIIMQLAMAPVGHGVRESRVDSGNVFIHPVKRARTTFSFLAVALMGDDEDKEFVREQLRSVHHQVVSTAASPVKYSANDPRLQLWVAACLYRWFVDQYEFLYGPIPPGQADAIYRDAATLATTLNVRPHMWPADREQFERYWEEQLGSIHIDPAVREHLLAIADLSFLRGHVGPVGTLLHLTLGKTYLFMTTGSLPQPFRDEMGFRWSPAQQRAFDDIRRMVAVVDRVAPVLKLMMRAQVLDVRLRRRAGIRVF